MWRLSGLNEIMHERHLAHTVTVCFKINACLMGMICARKVRRHSQPCSYGVTIHQKAENEKSL